MLQRTESSSSTARWRALREGRRNLHEFDTYAAAIAYLDTLFAAIPRARLSRQLGFRSPASASMFLSGQRLLTERAITGLTSILRLSQDEVLYLQLLAKDAAGAVHQREPTHDARKLSNEQFSPVSRWYNLPLFVLLTTVKRMPTLEWLERRLRGKVSAAEIIQSLSVWERLGFIKRKGRGLVTDQATFLHVDSPIPSSSIRRFHREMIARASEAIEEQDMGIRDLGTTLFTMDPARIPEAKAMLDRFRENFRRTFIDDQATEVCQLNYQFFWHTDLEPASKPPKDPQLSHH